jgi:hypothetical protein
MGLTPTLTIPGGTSGNFAGIGSGGRVVDSGKSPSSYYTTTQTDVAIATEATARAAADALLLSQVNRSRSIFVDPAGNDGSGAIGRIDKPLLTIPAAITAASAATPSSASPVAIYLAPGTYALGNNNYTLPQYVSLIGSGRGVSIVTNTKSSPANGLLKMGGNLIVANLTLQSLTNSSSVIGVSSSNGGNHVINCDLLGADTDCIYQNGGTGESSYWNCHCSAKFDVCRVFTGTVNLYTCILESLGPSNTAGARAAAIACGNGNVNIFGGVVRATGSLNLSVALGAFGSGTVRACAVMTDVIDAGNGETLADRYIDDTQTGNVVTAGCSRRDGGAVLDVNNGTGSLLTANLF